MKKWIALLVVILVVVLTWYVVRQFEFRPIWARAKFDKVSRGDIRVPVAASGLIHAEQVIEIKPEASGEIVEVRVVEGDYVHANDILVVLDPADEQRMLDRAQADFDRAEALLTQARVAVERAQVNIDTARARLEEIIAQGQMAEFELNKIEEALNEQGYSPLYNPQQINDARARVRMSHAQQQSARIAIDGAALAKQDAEAAVKSQEATVRSARKTLEDAQERLSETTVRATQDAIVTEVFVRVGMLVQSGTQSLTGGTPLMRLADVSSKKVIARLDEADYGRVLDISPVDALPEMPGLRQAALEDAAQMEKRGGVVTITVDAFPDEVFEGSIERVEPQGKLNAGSSVIQFDVRVRIDDESAHMLPLGAQAQVEFTVDTAEDALRVPAEAVKTYESQRGVYIKTRPTAGEEFGKRFVPCRFGISDGEFTQVIGVVGQGELKEGTEVYTKLPRDVDEDR